MHRRGLGPDPGKEPENYDSTQQDTGSSASASSGGNPNKTRVGEEALNEETYDDIEQDVNEAVEDEREDRASRGATRMIRELNDAGNYQKFIYNTYF